jgi:molecular chaperone HtpG
MRFVQQTEREVLDPSRELEIRISLDPDEGILTVKDTGIGMTCEEMKINLGTIAQSGARAFLDAADGDESDLVDVIGRFGVGFYSVFMVADWVKVTSRSYQTGEEAASWFATGADTFEIGSGVKEERGTTIKVKLKDDAKEFLQESRVREIVKTHSDYIPYPIFLNEEGEQINQGKALWRSSPQSIEDSQYEDYYRQLTLEMEPPLEKIHFVADAPLMIYALLYIPSQLDRGLFTLREQDGLKLYARKVLIEEYTQELLPAYFRFIQGVVDAEDLPLNVSRESVQASALMNRIKKILTNQVIQKLKGIASSDPQLYNRFWSEFGQFIKEGIAANDAYQEDLSALLRFRSTTMPDQWISLDEYLEHMKPGQDKVYYILGDDESAVSRSPHLDYFQNNCVEVLTLTDPVDSFMLLGLREYQGHPLQNVADSDLELPEMDEEKPDDVVENDDGFTDEKLAGLLNVFQDVLGDRVSEVRTTDRLSNSIARLVDASGALGQEMQRVYRMMDRDYQIPKKVLEINPKHSIVRRVSDLPEGSQLVKLVVEQIFESTLLVEGLHPDPASMIPRIEQLMTSALDGE